MQRQKASLEEAPPEKISFDDFRLFRMAWAPPFITFREKHVSSSRHRLGPTPLDKMGAAL